FRRAPPARSPLLSSKCSVDRERLSVATTNFADGTGGNARAYIACLLEHHGSVFSTCYSGRISYSGWGTPISHLSNQPIIRSRRSIRCHGSPERESSCVSRRKITIAVARLRNFGARNSCSPPESGGV